MSACVSQIKPTLHSRPAVHRLLEDEDSSTRRVNRAMFTVYGGSEFAVKAELERQHPSFTDIVILTVEPR